MIGQEEVLRDYKERYPYFFLLFLAFFVLVFFRLFYLQIYKGASYRRVSEQNSLKIERHVASRGLVFDRKGRLLVNNEQKINIVVTRQFVKNKEELVGKLAKLTGRSYEKLLENYNRESVRTRQYTPMVLIENASWEEIIKVEKALNELDGVAAVSTFQRSYPYQSMGAHLMGYINKVNEKELSQDKGRGLRYHPHDSIGRVGVEGVWEKHLRGYDGTQYVLTDAKGRKLVPGKVDSKISTLVGESQEPISGFNIHLTLDLDLQEVAFEHLKDKVGTVIALDAKTGEVLAMHSSPSFNPQSLVEGKWDEWKSMVSQDFGPLRNKAIQDHFPPGSTFKPFSALAGLREGVLTPEKKVFCKGSHTVGRRPFHCHKKSGHGWVNLESAMKQSCNVYYYKMSEEMKSVDPIAQAARDYGFGEKTKIPLKNEIPGLIPTEAWKKKTYNQRWNLGETLGVAIGQSYTSVTPLQLAAGYATLVNGGYTIKPRIIKDFVNPQTHEKINPVNDPNLVGPIQSERYDQDAYYLERIKNGLSKVVNEPGGTGYYRVRSDKVKIGGKSGTALVRSRSRNKIYDKCDKMPYKDRHHAWFVGFAPVQDPEIVVVALVMHGCSGSRTSGPIVKDVIENYWDNKYSEQSVEDTAQLSL